MFYQFIELAGADIASSHGNPNAAPAPRINVRREMGVLLPDMAQSSSSVAVATVAVVSVPALYRNGTLCTMPRTKACDK